MVLCLDVGGGRAGILKALAFAKSVPGARNGFIHVLFPRLSDFDAARWEDLGPARNELRHVGFSDGGDAPVVAPSPGCVHYCHHRLVECDCIARYPLRSIKALAAVSVHSLYYLTESDLKRLQEMAGAIHLPAATLVAVVHRPKEGKLPVLRPEFQFMDVADAGHLVSPLDRMAYGARALLYGARTMAMVPLSNNGTVYIHDALAWLSSGFHSSPLTRWLDELTRRGTVSCALAGALILAAVVGVALLTYYAGEWTYFAYLRAVRSPGVLERIPGIGRYFALRFEADSRLAWAGLLAVGTYAVSVAMTRWWSWASDEPGPATDMTVSVAGITTIADGSGHGVADVLRVTIGQPRKLVRSVFTDVGIIEPRAFDLAMCLYSQNPAAMNDAAVHRATATVMRRYGYNYLSARASAQQAAELFMSLNPNDPAVAAGSTRRRTYSTLAWLLRLPFALAYQILSCFTVVLISGYPVFLTGAATIVAALVLLDCWD